MVVESEIDVPEIPERLVWNTFVKEAVEENLLPEYDLELAARSNSQTGLGAE